MTQPEGPEQHISTKVQLVPLTVVLKPYTTDMILVIGRHPRIKQLGTYKQVQVDLTSVFGSSVQDQQARARLLQG